MVFGHVMQAQFTADVAIIPQPQSLINKPGKFVLNKHTRIIIRNNNEELKRVAKDLSETIGRYLNFSPAVEFKPQGLFPRNAVILELADGTQESYTLEITSSNIRIRGQMQGVFYGIQTLYQLFPVKNSTAKITLPALSIEDEPEFPWRGFMLDVSRNFFSVQDIKRYLDFLAFHKINVFHWHLTDDQGWRIEIKKYPRLTELGAWRNNTLLELSGKQWSFQPHGGFYTQEQIKEIVAYAAERFITVVPEIEMPGHSTAALASYPELSCANSSLPVSVNWGVHKDIYCAGKGTTFKFLEDVLSEVFSLFPSEYIHIGGDEAPKDRWKECPHCQQKISREKLKNEEALQGYFINRIADFSASHGKKIIGWDENLEGGLSENVTVMCWRGFDGAIHAARKNHDVIMTHSKFTYFDHYQSEPSLEPLAWAGLVPNGYTRLRKVYDFNPVPPGLTESESKHIIGVQANLWTEYIRYTDHLDYMVFPRLSALAEVMWTDGKNKNWNDFLRRLETQKDRYASMGIHYSNSNNNVYYTIQLDSLQKTATIQLETDSYDPEIYYSLDGSEPSANSLRYTVPFTVELNTNIKAASFRSGKRISKVNARSIPGRMPVTN